MNYKGIEYVVRAPGRDQWTFVISYLEVLTPQRSA